MLKSNHSRANGPPPPKLSRRLVALVFSLGTIFGSGLAYGYQGIMATSNHFSPKAVEGKYSLLHLGMSPTDAKSILGPGTEVGQSKSHVEILWSSSNGCTLTAIFEDGKLVEKKKIGL